MRILTASVLVVAAIVSTPRVTEASTFNILIEDSVTVGVKTGFSIADATSKGARRVFSTRAQGTRIKDVFFTSVGSLVEIAAGTLTEARAAPQINIHPAYAVAGLSFNGVVRSLFKPDVKAGPKDLLPGTLAAADDFVSGTGRAAFRPSGPRPSAPAVGMAIGFGTQDPILGTPTSVDGATDAGTAPPVQSGLLPTVASAPALPPGLVAGSQAPLDPEGVVVTQILDPVGLGGNVVPGNPPVTPSTPGMGPALPSSVAFVNLLPQSGGSTPTVVPLPAGAVLLVSALVLVAGVARRRQTLPP